MLKQLYVKNYVLIDQLDIKINSGLTVITGETGAGKSIILGALGLLMGNRADSKVLLNNNEKCVVEAFFEISNLNLKPWFLDNDIDYEPVCQIRREVNNQGKSRAFINDTPVNLEQLKSLSSYLIDIHSQHDNLFLTSVDYQMNLLDTYSGINDLFDQYQKAYREMIAIHHELQKLEEEEIHRSKEKEYEEFIYEELKRAGISDCDYESLEEDIHRYENTEEIRCKLNELKKIIDNEELSIIPLMAQSVFYSEKLALLSKQFNPIKERLKTLNYELKDILSDLEKFERELMHDDASIFNKKQKYDLINNLIIKHKCKTFSDLKNYFLKLESKINDYQHSNEKLEQLSMQYNETKKIAEQLALQLSEHRNKEKVKLENEIITLLGELGMKESELVWELKKDELYRYGYDKVRLLFSANKGHVPGEIKNIASGGEFSRLMFCLKFVLAKKNKLPTLILDEIDTGISGEVALKMAKMLKIMAQKHQLIAITHLPQIAASGDFHYYVYKKSSNGKTISTLKELTYDERVNEIATMMSGSELSASVKQSAMDLLNYFN